MDEDSLKALLLLAILVGAFLILRYIFTILPKQAKAKYSQARNANTSVGRTIRDSESMIETNYGKIKKYAQKNISKNYLTGCTWLLTNSEESILYTFRNSGELLITTNGIVKKREYELIVDNNSILITQGRVMEHYSIVNVYSDFLFLHRLSSDSILMFANYTKFKDEVKSNLNEEANRLFEVR
jgi:hypothetical protein